MFGVLAAAAVAGCSARDRRGATGGGGGPTDAARPADAGHDTGDAPHLPDAPPTETPHELVTGLYAGDLSAEHVRSWWQGRPGAGPPRRRRAGKAPGGAQLSPAVAGAEKKGVYGPYTLQAWRPGRQRPMARVAGAAV